MPNLLIRDLPDDIHAALQRRAKHEGQSLQQYVSRELARMVQRPTVTEVLDRIEHRSAGSLGFAPAVDAVDEGRVTR